METNSKISRRKEYRQASKRVKLLLDDADIDELIAQEADALETEPPLNIEPEDVQELMDSIPTISKEVSNALKDKDTNLEEFHVTEDVTDSGNLEECHEIQEETGTGIFETCSDLEQSRVSEYLITEEELCDSDYDWRGLDEDDYEDDEDAAVEIPGEHVNLADKSFLFTSIDLSELHSLREEIRLEEVKPDEGLQKELAQWTTQNNIVHEAVDELLAILKRNGHPSLPCSSKTLLKTPRAIEATAIRCIGEGAFWYHGILKSMAPYLTSEFLHGKTIIVIDVFMDGVSPYKSIRRSLWPIVGSIVGTNFIFIIAMWCGNSKEPKDLDGYLHDFVEEAKRLMNGFTFKGKTYKLKIRKYIADAPARAWLRNVKSHLSYNSCERCTIRGQWRGRITYQAGAVGELRTDESFVQRLHHEHHLGSSPLEELGTQMISQWPLDGMHLVHLGVMKRILHMLCSKKKSSIHTMNENELHILSAYVKSYSSYCPCEFPRKPRALSEWKLFKATELRRLLLYDGLLIFRELSSEVHSNFLLLHCAMRILSDQSMSNYYDDAEYLLKKFVEHAGSRDVYGATFIVFNVHALLHFAEECRRHGSVEDFSAYKYENFLGKLRKYLHAPGRTLTQIIARIIEEELLLRIPAVKEVSRGPVLSRPHSSGPSLNLNGKAFQQVTCSEMKFNLTPKDSCCLMKTGDIVEIKNILETRDGEIWIVGQKYNKKENFFSYPMDSSLLGIYSVSGLCELGKWKLQDVRKKFMRLPISTKHSADPTKRVKTNSFLCIPLVHEFHV